jgi:hypothetical protein
MTESLHPVPDPAEFDFEEFLSDARLAEESVTVYKRADVIAELSDLKRRIQLEDRANGGERAASEEALTPLEQEYKALLETFSESALTIYVRALTDEELREQRKLTEERTKELPPQDANLEFGYDLLARSIIAMKSARGERKPVTFNASKVKTLRKAIGDTQVDMILKARQMAQNAMPSVDADFLLRRSGEEAGNE